MNPVRSILVIVDPTASEHPCVAKAAQLAHCFSARLDLYVCESRAKREARLTAHATGETGRGLGGTGKKEPSPAPSSLDPEDLAQSMAAPLRERGLEVTIETQCGDPLHGVLLERTGRAVADLIVKDTHHHSLLRRTLLSNTDWELIRHCPVPLLLTRPGAWRKPPRIVAAVDPTHANDKSAALDRRILDHAANFARQLEGEFHAVHAYLPMSVVAVAGAAAAPPLMATISPEELAMEERTRREQLVALGAEYGLPERNIHLATGGPAALLPRMADAVQADILVMGAIARSGLKRVFIGSTAEDVLESLPCDALIVKPPDFSGALPFSL